MERLWGLFPCCILLATFLIVRTALGQQIQWVQEPDSAYYVVKKQPVNITCEAYGASKITFTCAGSQIPPTSQKTYESFDEARQQTLVRSSIQVSRSDIVNYEGSFWCECNAWVDDSSVLSTSRRATVGLAYLKKDFVEEPASQRAKVGEMVVFNCVPPEGQPFPEVLWRRDQKRVEPSLDSNVVVSSDGSLTIVKVRQQDEGTYQCVAKNDAGRRESKDVQLTVESEPEPSAEFPPTGSPTDTAKPRTQRDSGGPQFLEEPQAEVYVTPNEPVSIVCDVRGADILTFRCNGQRVTKQLEEKNNRTAKAIHSVLNWTFAEVENFLNTYREDAFECMCVAWYTEAIKDQQVGWKSLQSATGQILLAYLNTDFKAQPLNAVVQAGSDATFACSPPEGKPNPWVYWVFEQQRLDPRTDTRYSVSADGSLTVRQVTSADAGRYYCMAENAMGTRRSEIARLTVSDEPVTTTPEATVLTTDGYEPTFPSTIPSSPVFILDLPSSTYLSSEGEADLVCSVVSADTLTYRCNGQRLSEDSQEISVKTDSVTRKRLLTARTTVTNFDIEDSQQQRYKCQCFAWYIDPVAKQWNFITGTEVEVFAPTLDIKFAYEPQGGLFPLGDVVELSCQPPSGNPIPQISWLKNGQEIVQDADSNIVILDEGTLVVESVRQEDAGEYICVATNTAGSARSRPAVVEVYDPTPKPTRRTTTSMSTSTTAAIFTSTSATTTTTTTITTATATTTPTTPSTTVTSPITSTSPVISTTQLDSSSSSASPAYSTTFGSSPEPIDDLAYAEGSLPFFASQPQQRMYIEGDEPVTLNCVAVRASVLVFFCNGQKVSQEQTQFKTTDPVSGMVYVENSLVVRREELSAASSDAPYRCQCRAYYREDDSTEWKYIPSDDFFVETAYLDRKFVQEPVSQTVQEGVSVELQCSPPKGVPAPAVYWLKDRYRIVENKKYHLMAEGNLVIESAGADDEGNYICVAESIVGSIYSQAASLRVTSEGSVPEPSTTVLGPSTTPEAASEPEPEPTDSSPEPEPAPEPPKWVTQPEALYYIVKSKPVTTTCQALGAQRITFSCNTKNIPDSRVQYQTTAENMGPVMEASIEISREEVEAYNTDNGGDDFWCQCSVPYQVPGISSLQELTSTKAKVQVAYLKKPFVREPFNVTVNEGEFLSLPCEPPEGNPEPEVYWLFNNERIEEYIPTLDNAFVIESVKPENGGVFVCVAENLANKRLSRPAIITVTSSTGPQVVDDNTCMTMLKECGDIMPKPRENLSTCQKLTQYKECLRAFREKCTGVLREESIEAASRSSEMVEQDCSSSRDVCQELLTCQNIYSQQSVPNTSADSMPMVILCSGIQSFLHCADTAAKDCRISLDSQKISLTTIADWFEHYCIKVVEDKWASMCNQLSRCDLPIQQTTVLANLVQTSLWCRYVEQTMTCTRDALSDCGLSGVSDGLDLLSDYAVLTCPASPDSEPEPKGKKDKKDDDDEEEEEDDDEEEEEDENGDTDEEGTPEGADKTVTDDKTDIGKSIGEAEGSASHPYSSFLLTSLLAVAFVWLACR